MPDNILFNLAFLSQIVLISAWLPRVLYKRARHILETYPADQYPRLYPKGAASYERNLVHFVYMNVAIFLVGMFFWVVFNTDATNSDYQGVSWAIFMLQTVPFFLVELFMFRTWKLMRECDKRTTRKAALRSRGLGDVMSPLQVGLVVGVFAVFSLFIAYIDQFGFPWFGGYLNVLVIGLGNAFLAALVAWNIYGRKKDPYMEEKDRINRTRLMARQFVLVSVAVTVYAMVIITLQAFDLYQYKQLAMALYAQLLAIGFYFTFYQDQTVNFEVYREEPSMT